ncbi:hypothetical protein [Photobacterium minamisatsumaniensis]|uniref:hypothetical protein n=1 Tax=Photobacterium minamisatsumaniensis TaxID=2910233 RepID=UPI003D0BB8B4
MGKLEITGFAPWPTIPIGSQFLSCTFLVRIFSGIDSREDLVVLFLFLVINLVFSFDRTQIAMLIGITKYRWTYILTSTSAFLMMNLLVDYGLELVMIILFGLWFCFSILYTRNVYRLYHNVLP